MEDKIKKQITGTIESVVPARQVNTQYGQKQTYDVTINKNVFNTFDQGYQNKVGQSGTWDYTITNKIGRDGRPRTYYTLDNLTKASTPSSGAGNSQEIVVELKSIKGLLEQLLALKRADASFESPMFPISDDDIPVIDHD